VIGPGHFHALLTKTILEQVVHVGPCHTPVHHHNRNERPSRELMIKQATTSTRAAGMCG
jgi:hypothetical protein